MKEYTVRVHDGGSKFWYLNGKRHREDGPAIEHFDGTKEWFLNGQRHREDGPAIIYALGSKCWFLNGNRHRIGGPAVEYTDGSKEWFLNGVIYSEEEYWNQLKPAKELTVAEIESLLGYKIKVVK